jgi:hypothetical protein
VCIFSYWIYVGLGCIVVHLPLTTVGVCVDPVGVDIIGQVYVGGVDGNVHVKPVSILPVRVLSRIPSHSLANSSCCASLKPLDDAVHVPSVGVAVWPAMVEGLHVDVGGVGGVTVTVVLPSGQVTAADRRLAVGSDLLLLNYQYCLYYLLLQ